MSDKYLWRKYAGRQSVFYAIMGYVKRLLSVWTWRRADIIWIEKELFPFLPAPIELMLLCRKKVVIDIDDAIFHNYDLHPSWIVRRFLGRKIDTLFRRADLVVAGNQYLANRAINAGAKRTAVVPTVVDLSRYLPKLRETTEWRLRTTPPIRIGWIGSPATVHYLALIREPLQRLSRLANIRLVVIGGGFSPMEGVAAVNIAWDEATEAANIRSFDIGVMPLIDDAWERGKCGYKIIQYMACGIPSVASPIGVNTEIIEHGINGYLASTNDEWFDRLRSLVLDPDLRFEFGARGRKRVLEKYSLAATSVLIHRLFVQTIEGG